MLALWSGARQSDILRLPWSAYDGKHIRLRQGKTGTDLNLDEARLFLDALGAGEIFSFQTFVDRKATSKEEKQLFDKLACKRHGTFDQYAKELVCLNCLKESDNPRGIYVTINRTNGKGRKAQDVIGVRAVFVDLDGAPVEPVSEGPLKPSIVVESSTKKFHAYWLAAAPPSTIRL